MEKSYPLDFAENSDKGSEMNSGLSNDNVTKKKQDTIDNNQKFDNLKHENENLRLQLEKIIDENNSLRSTNERLQNECTEKKQRLELLLMLNQKLQESLFLKNENVQEKLLKNTTNWQPTPRISSTPKKSYGSACEASTSRTVDSHEVLSPIDVNNFEETLEKPENHGYKTPKRSLKRKRLNLSPFLDVNDDDNSNSSVITTEHVEKKTSDEDDLLENNAANSKTNGEEEANSKTNGEEEANSISEKESCAKTEKKNYYMPDDYEKKKMFLEKFEIDNEDNGKTKMIYLKHGISMPAVAWRSIYNKKNQSLFTKALLNYLYTKEELRKRCVEERSHVRTPRGKNLRRQLSPKKNDTIRVSVEYYVRKKLNKKTADELQPYMDKINHAIGEEINKYIKEYKKIINKEEKKGTKKNSEVEKEAGNDDNDIRMKDKSFNLSIDD